MSLFLSTYVNKIDKKGRVSVPASFRNVLVNEKFQGIVAYASFISTCIEGCGMGRIEQLSESIDALDPYSDERDAFAATILGGSIQLPFDGEGRVILPESLIKEAGISDQVAFVGKGITFEMWDPNTFTSYADKAKMLAKEKRAHLRLATHRGGDHLC